MFLALVDNLILPSTHDFSLLDVHPHLGLISLATVLEKAGHCVRIYDPKREVRFGHLPYDEGLYSSFADKLLRERPDAVGFTTLGCSFIFAVNVAKWLKFREPDIPILLGGPHASILDRQVLEAYSAFDIVVRHEAEEVLPLVIDSISSRDFDDIPGVTWRASTRSGIKATPGKPRIADLNSLPIPRYDFYPIKELNLKLMRIEAGRGCPFECTFCSTASFFQRDYRLKQASRLVEEMDILQAEYGVTEFKLDHDLFTVNRRKVEAFCDAVRNRNYKWRVSARTDCVDDALLEKMALAGCIGLYFGIESGSERIQKSAKKRLDVRGVETILDSAASYGIETTASFITGYPDECAEDQTATLDMVGRCFARPHDYCTPQLHILVPEPGTALHHANSASLRYDGYTTKFNARVLSPEDEKQIITHPELYPMYYYYPGILQRDAYTLAVDLVDALRLAGQDILGYALRFYDGRLSTMIGDCRNFCVEQVPARTVDADTILTFLTARFGEDHHLVSLFRFGYQVNDDRSRITAGSEIREVADRKTASLRGTYCLRPGVYFLDDIHDCSRMLRHIRRLSQGGDTLSGQEVGPRGCFMFVVRGERTESYCIDDGVEELLQLFARPMSMSKILAAIREFAPDGTAHIDLFKRMIGAGVLMRVSDATSLPLIGDAA